MVEGLGITDEAGWVIADDRMKTTIQVSLHIGDGVERTPSNHNGSW